MFWNHVQQIGSNQHVMNLYLRNKCQLTSLQRSSNSLISFSSFVHNSLRRIRRCFSDFFHRKFFFSCLPSAMLLSNHPHLNKAWLQPTSFPGSSLLHFESEVDPGNECRDMDIRWLSHEESLVNLARLKYDKTHQIPVFHFSLDLSC